MPSGTLARDMAFYLLPDQAGTFLAHSILNPPRAAMRCPFSTRPYLVSKFLDGSVASVAVRSLVASIVMLAF